MGTDALSGMIERAFPGRSQEARAILARNGTEAHEREQERIHLAAVDLSGGDIEELKRLIDLAKQDRRDILLWAERKRSGANRP